MPRRTALQRFMSRITVDPVTGCWIWTGATHRKKHPYGKMTIDRKTVYVHRFAYEQFIGPIPEGLELDHFVCQKTLCANPNHLEPVTHRENLLRGNGIAGMNSRVTHCPQRHEYSDENTYRGANRRPSLPRMSPDQTTGLPRPKERHHQ